MIGGFLKSLTTFLECVFTQEWMLNNFGTILGAGIGAFSAYLIGAAQTRKQIELSQLPEKIQRAKQELIFLRQLQEAIETVGRLLENGKNPMTEPGFESIFPNLKDKWWIVLGNPRLAEKMDNFLDELVWVNIGFEDAQSRKEGDITTAEKRRSMAFASSLYLYELGSKSERAARRVIGLREGPELTRKENAALWIHWRWQWIRVNIFRLKAKHFEFSDEK